MQIFVNGKRRFHSFIEFFVIHLKKSRKKNMIIVALKLLTVPTAPLGYSQKKWVGLLVSLSRTSTVLGTKICDSPFSIYDLTRNLIPHLRPAL